ncbi:HU family DNA-binding protein [Cetobacterium sp.]|uniref:HU family DNA-binding protein n=1 Tax=Cetobacterium sp. TaxID=2071632 RepID=UPI003F3B84BA
MTKNNLIELLVEKNHFETKASAERCVNFVLDTMKDKLTSGEIVDLYGFGKFEITERAEKKGRNPKTGEEILIPAKKAVKFKSAKALKDSINK